jgi:HSP20 family protein
MAEDLIFDNAIFYLNDFEMPRITTNGEIVFETYGTPDFEIETQEDKILLRADLEGYRKDELTVSVQDNVLTIAGKRENTASSDDNIKSCGTFYREVYIPRSVAQKKISVSFRDNHLLITLPRKKQEKLRVLKIE